jgi:hypothetical protein
MKWIKHGLVFVPDGSQAWARTHALLPTVEVRDPERLRVYFAALDREQLGRIGWVELAAADPRRVLAASDGPVLDLGRPGTFDDSGVTPSCVVEVDGATHLYYVGWQRAERVPYMLFTGLAISRDGGRSFVRSSEVPVLDRTPSEPFSRGAPFVARQGAAWVAWYWSCEHWSIDGQLLHYNNVIRRAHSADGIVWPGASELCLSPEPPEYSLGRPWVLERSGKWHMWYSSRSLARPYRMGYADSADGRTWTRRDAEVGIFPSESGWDSEMVCFPCVIEVNGKTYMFYNGNHHGKTGFGLAELEHV